MKNVKTLQDIKDEVYSEIGFKTEEKNLYKWLP